MHPAGLGSASAPADHQLDAAHEQIQRQLQGTQRSMQPHPPSAGTAAAVGGRAQRHSAPRPVPAASQETAAAAGAPVAPQESLPYHRKRLLELVDPATYEAVLADTAAQQLGFELAMHPEQRWVVEALFLAPLPQGVVRCYDAMARAYYFDQNTQTSSWAHPCAKQFEALLQAQAPKPAESAAASLPATPKRRAAHRPLTEEKSNADDFDDSGSDDEDGSETTTTTAATSPSKPATQHSKSFLRSNAGLSSTSSLFLTEEELAHWNDGDAPPPPPNRRGGRAARGGRRGASAAKSSPWINDELGGRDGERWAGEDDEAEDPEAQHARLEQQREAHAAAARIRASSAARARVRASRPSSAYPTSVAATGSASASAARSWNSQQPQPFHPWANARGTGDTEHVVPHPGSLIAPAPFAPSISAAAVAVTTRSSLNSRPSSGVQSRPTSAFHGSSTAVDAAFRAQQSQQIREGHKITRARINGSLRSKASHLYTLRATLLTKLRALSRLHDGALTADEKSWRELGGDVRAFTAVNNQRTHLFRQAFPMLDADDARALGRMLHRSSQELDGASARVSQALLESSALKAQVLGLQQDLQREVENASESLKVDAQCLEIARTGLAGDAAAATAAAGSMSHAPSTSLPRIHELLDLVLHFQNHARTHGAKLGARLVSEKKLLAELSRANQIVLRRGAQHASERREQIVAQLLANKATIPGLTAQVKELQANLHAQIEPLAVCQRTYELRRNESSLDDGSSGPSSVHLRDENLDLLHGLEDELAALTTLVAHLESELGLTQSNLSSTLDRDRTLKAEASAEEVRTKFYRSALAVQPGPSQVPLIRRGSTQNQLQQHHHSEQQPPQDRPRSRDTSPSRLGASFTEQQPQQWTAAPPPHPPAHSRPASSKPYSVVGATRPSSSQSLRSGGRPASATSAAPLSGSDLQHVRSQLVRDQAANLERLRTRKVRRAKIAQGAATKQELLIPNAGRPVFEGGNDGYES